jgi:flagellar motility protein MotE (MotC chaperone)
MPEERQRERKIDEEAPEVQEPTPKKLAWLPYVGGFFLSFAVMVTAMWFLHPAMRAARQDAAEMADSLQQVSALIQGDPESVSDSTSKSLPQKQGQPEQMHGATPVVQASDSLVEHIEALKSTLSDQQRDMQVLGDSISQMAVEHNQLIQEIDTMRQRELELSSAEIKRLARVFGSMKPKSSAPVLLKMDLTSVAAILLSIEERKAAKIMASMPAEKAAAISKLIRKRALEKAKMAGKTQ